MPSGRLRLPQRTPANSSSLRADRLLQIAILALVTFAGIGAMLHNIAGPHYGYDFRGILDAARAIADGRSPYTGASARALLLQNNPYVLPPLIGELTIALSHLPYAAAIVVFNAICCAAMVASLWILDVRDWRLYLITLFSLPFIDSLWLGQPEGVFALALAVAWRYRDSWAAVVAVAFLVVAKLLLWPLVLWLLFTRRLIGGLLAAGLAAALLAITWAAIGFDGLSGYLHRLSLDARAFEPRSHSIAAAAVRAGVTINAADVLGLAVAVVLALAIIIISKRSDLGLFTAAIAFALFASPLLWTHYLVVLFVPLAVARRRLDALWLLTAVLYLSPVEPVVHLWQILLIPVIGAVLALAVVIPSGRPALADLRS